MIPEILIYPYKRLQMLLRQEVPTCETTGIFLTANAEGCEEWAYLDDTLILDVHDTLNARDPKVFTEEHGRQVLAFLQRNKNAGRICVSCDSGQSRSTAMAAAIVRYFGGDDLFIWEDPRYHPNTVVYRRQLAAFGMDISTEELARLRRLSDEALSAAIRKSRGG
ncbi:MAG: hypothetical protein IJO88_06190 [Oscillospiraceae bacterium]|nr:hypothetical protein [Oscillospiraceae bacterium]